MKATANGLRSKGAATKLGKWEDDTDEDDATPRVLTDGLCCFLFLAMIGGMCFMYWDARKTADIRRLTHGIDWMGQVCGVDKNVTDKPLLYWCVSEGLLAADGICVDSCPASTATSHLCPGRPETRQTVRAGTAGQYRVDLTISRSVGYVTDHASQNAFEMFCLPSDMMNLTVAALPQLEGVVPQLTTAVAAMHQNAKFLRGLAIVALALSFVMVLTVVRILRQAVPVLVVFLGTVLAAGSAFFAYATFDPAHNPYYVWAGEKGSHQWALGTSVALGVLFLIYSMSVRCLMSASEKSLKAISLASETIDNLPTLVLAPIMQFVIKMAALVLTLFGLLTVLSLAKIRSPMLDDTNGTGLFISGVGRSLQIEDWQWRWVVAWIAGSIWVQETVIALGQYAIGHAVVMYVLNRDEVNRILPLSHGFLNGLVYHLGTCAFGGFVIGVISLVSAGCKILAKQTRDKDGKPNAAAATCCCCCQCLCSFVESMVRLSNKLVYVDCAIFGSDYPEAAWQVFHILTKHAATVATAEMVAKLLNFLCVGSLSAAGTLITYFYFKAPGVNAMSALHSARTMGMSVAAFVICYTLSSTFVCCFNAVLDAQVYVHLIREEKYNIPFGERKEGIALLLVADTEDKPGRAAESG